MFAHGNFFVAKMLAFFGNFRRNSGMDSSSLKLTNEKLTARNIPHDEFLGLLRLPH